ncbi:transglutaminase-like domain-containing protein [Paenibacillus sp. GYB003]|uniref:transglutaminase-like domain-containing protein n=1 Tax=Paenibacillus sp. GYB003 TaxID=2994392 RepID=UPI002F961D92
MRNVLLAVVAMFALLWCAPIVQAVQSDDWLGLERVNDGIVTIRYDVNADVKTKLMIAKEQTKYTYRLPPDKREQSFPLQMGNGDYTISVLEQVGGTKYKVVREATVKLELAQAEDVYLNSVQNVEWSETSRAVQIAKELTKTSATDSEKVQAVYEYVIGTIRYDDALASSDLADYIPDIDRTIAEGKDICYGYASLFAAMLRSVDIPAKLVMGTSEYVEAYHAWNEVYLNGAWVTVDTTVDAGWKGSGTAFEMVKDAGRYAAVKYY